MYVTFGSGQGTLYTLDFDSATITPVTYTENSLRLTEAVSFGEERFLILFDSASRTSQIYRESEGGNLIQLTETPSIKSGLVVDSTGTRAAYTQRSIIESDGDIVGMLNPTIALVSLSHGIVEEVGYGTEPFFLEMGDSLVVRTEDGGLWYIDLLTKSHTRLLDSDSTLPPYTVDSANKTIFLYNPIARTIDSFMITETGADFIESRPLSFVPRAIATIGQEIYVTGNANVDGSYFTIYALFSGSRTDFPSPNQHGVPTRLTLSYE